MKNLGCPTRGSIDHLMQSAVITPFGRCSGYIAESPGGSPIFVIRTSPPATECDASSFAFASEMKCVSTKRSALMCRTNTSGTPLDLSSATFKLLPKGPIASA